MGMKMKLKTTLKKKTPKLNFFYSFSLILFLLIGSYLVFQQYFYIPLFNKVNPVNWSEVEETKKIIQKEKELLSEKLGDSYEDVLGDTEYEGEPITMTEQLKDYIYTIDGIMYIVDGSFELIESEKENGVYIKLISDIGKKCINDVYPYSKKEIPKKLLTKVENIEKIMPRFCNDLVDGMEYMIKYSKAKNVDDMEDNFTLARETNGNAYDKSMLISKLTDEIWNEIE